MNKQKTDAENESEMTPEAGARPAGKRRVRGSTAVYQVLREDILSLKCEPGSALDEVALAERFKLSRTPVREALLMLASEDLVRFLPNRSTIVMPHNMSNSDEYMDTLLLLARALTRLAAIGRTQNNLQEIRDRQSEYAAALESGDNEAIIAADLAFHRAVSSASGNQFMHNFFSLTLDYGRRMMLLHYYPHFDASARQSSLTEHDDIVDALERQDPDAAENAASRHVYSGLRVIQKSLEPRVGASISLSGDTTSYKGGHANEH